MRRRNSPALGLLLAAALAAPGCSVGVGVHTRSGDTGYGAGVTIGGDGGYEDEEPSRLEPTPDPETPEE